MSSPRDRSRQRAQIAARQRAADDAMRRAARTRRAVAGGVVACALLAAAVAVVAATAEDDETASPTTTTGAGSSTSTSTTAGPPVSTPLPVAGGALTGTTPCPATDGSQERVTSFDAAPPQCLATTADGAVDPAVTYRATVRTSVGDLVYLLDTEHAPEAVNSFVTLARYHYFDGAPIDTITSTAWAELGGRFADGDAGASYTLATETSEAGSIPVPGSLAAMPSGPDGATATAGRLVMVLGENAADLPLRTTFFALLLDGNDAFTAIMRAGTESGAPTASITIEEIVIDEERDDGA
jgi:cyclophilin family peptidyl-prolyl cis-trans isomerase